MALVLLGLSALASLLFIPFTFALTTATGPNAAGAAIGLVFLSVIRGAVLITALINSIGGGQALLLVIAAVVMEIVSCGLHIAAAGSGSSLPYYIGYEAAATLLPAVLIAAGFLALSGHRMVHALLLAGALLPLVAGAAGLAAAKAQDAAKRERYEALEREAEERAGRQRAALDAVPAGAGVSRLLAFAGGDYESAVRSAAIARIVKTPGARAQLESLPDDLAKELVPLAVQHERLAELAAIPESAGLEALFPFAAPDENPVVISAAQQRIRERKDAENELRTALRGSKKLTALGVLASYDWHGINEATVHLALTAAGVAARELDARMASANRPSKAELEGLCSAVGILVARNETVAKAHAAELRKLKSIGACAQLRLPDL